jgi:hypothetical protein
MNQRYLGENDDNLYPAAQLVSEEIKEDHDTILLPLPPGPMTLPGNESNQQVPLESFLLLSATEAESNNSNRQPVHSRFLIVPRQSIDLSHLQPLRNNFLVIPKDNLTDPKTSSLRQRLLIAPSSTDPYIPSIDEKFTQDMLIAAPDPAVKTSRSVIGLKKIDSVISVDTQYSEPIYLDSDPNSRRQSVDQQRIQEIKTEEQEPTKLPAVLENLELNTAGAIKDKTADVGGDSIKAKSDRKSSKGSLTTADSEPYNLGNSVALVSRSLGSKDDRDPSDVTESGRIRRRRKTNVWDVVTASYDQLATNEEEKGGGKAVTLTATLASIFLLLLKLVYINVSRKALELFDCTYSESSYHYYFDVEPNRQCYVEWWNNLLPIAVLSILFYVIGIPLLFFVLFYQRRRFLKIPMSQRTKWQTFLLQATFKKKSEFQPETEYWDVVLLCRKLAIIVCQLMFSQYTAFQAQVLVIILLLFLVGHVYISPYSMRSLNFLEGVSLLSSILVLSCGLMFYVSEFQTNVAVDALAYAVLVIVAVSSLLVLGMLIYHVRSMYLKHRLAKKRIAP